MGTGKAPGAGGEDFLFPVLPPDPELNPEASEFVATLLPRSDNEDSSKAIKIVIKIFFQLTE